MLGPIAKILRIVKSYVTLNKMFCRYNFKDEQVYSTQWDYISMINIFKVMQKSAESLRIFILISKLPYSN